MTREEQLRALAKKQFPYAHQSIIEAFVLGGKAADANDPPGTRLHNLQLLAENELLWDRIYQIEEKIKELQR